MSRELEKVEKAIEHLENCMMTSPSHLKGILVINYTLIDRALITAKEAIEERDELRNNLIESARRSERATVDFVNSVIKGEITLDPEGKKG